MRCLALLLLLVFALPARADILLDGSQHIGDCNDDKGECVGFTPLGPVSRDAMFNTPTHFSLTTTTTITGVRLDNPIGLTNLEIYIQPQGSPLIFRAGVLLGNTLTLVPAIVLPPGLYSILTDGGCDTVNGSGTFFYTDCGVKGNDHDFGFSSITLLSPQTGTSRMLNQRRHIGDNADKDEDDYEYPSDSDPWYPDDPEGPTIDIPFNVDANRRLVEIRFRRLRGVDNNNSQVLVDGLFIGNLLDTGNPDELDPTTLSTNLLLLSGPHSLRVASAILSGSNHDDFSWDDIVLLFSDVAAAGTLGSFNAVDPAQSALTGHIRTKVAGDSSAALDLYALNAFGTATNASYTGAANVYLLNTTDNTGTADAYGCLSSWQSSAALGSALFVNGHATLTPTWPVASLRDARIKITDPLTGASGCSYDNFAIRPNSFSIAISHGSESTAGTTELLNNVGTSGTPRHRAGQFFTIQATALAVGGATVTGYDGTPTTLVASALAPATVSGSAQAGTWTAMGGGVVRSDTARYLEVGPVSFNLYDDSYASVDLGDSSVADMRIAGAANAGRFIPDHFTLTSETSAPTFAPRCGTFTYVGEPFPITPAPYRMSITAVEAGGNTTRNYTGTLDKLPAGNLATNTIFPALTGAVVATNAPAPPAADHTLTDRGNGVTRYELLPTQFAFTRGAPAVPFNAEIAIQPGALNEGDGVDFAAGAGSIGAPTAGNGVAFIGNAKQMRFGRMVVDNAQGSERLPLDVPMRTEYWDSVSGNQGFVVNVADNCTVLLTSQIALGGTFAPNTSVQSVTGIAAGVGSARLAAPNASGAVTVTASITAAMPWLLRDGTNLQFNNEPQGLATFGLFSNGDKRIYQREVIGQ